MSKCGFCKTDILPEDETFMMAFENPYLNLYVHRSCWRSRTFPLKQEEIKELLENAKNSDIIEKKRKKMV